MIINWLNAHAVWGYLSVWKYFVIALIDTHITTMCVTLYLHRCQTHRSIDFSPPIAHFMRFWLWIRTAMPTKEWVAVHRCHHANVESAGDPHSPIFYGIWRVVFLGVGLYHKYAKNEEIVAQYGKGTPQDRLEFLYDDLSTLGPVVTLSTNIWLFGAWGLFMWLIEMAWIPFFAAGVINGLGHWWGYRNFDTPDNSRNLPGLSWAFLTCGESWHNNHHHVQNSPRFSVKRWEIDLGYLYFRIFQLFGLAHPTRQSVGV